ncbi:MAG: amidohydrolase [Candidatus Bathyarchaeota archaeon]|nr:MAG: amidohydrolase [Candidatus Bathyarchaeota archaeon]
MSKDAKRVAVDWVEGNVERLIEVSDAIWSYAELGFVEFKSAKLLSEELEAHGFEVERGVAGIPTAFVATWGKGSPVIGVMGEYDALPGLSQEAVPRKAPVEEGAPGHGCGHNIHGTSGMAGAIAVRRAMEKIGIPGTLKFFGCPAEEMLSGKVWMVREGVFDGVDAVLSHHPGSMNTAKLSSSNANNAVKFHFRGKTAHAAGNPEQGRSALDAVELMNMGVNYMREHMIQDARVHYTIEAGGGQPNVVPDYARSWYLIRAPERHQLEAIYDRILKIAEGAALMTETTLRVEFVKGIYNKMPNRTLSELVLGNMRKIGTPEYTDEERRFAAEISKTVTPEAKRDSLWKTKRPGWEELLDVLLDDTVPDDWNEGEVGHGSTDVSDVSWNTPTMEFGTTTYPLGAPGHSWQIVALSGTSIGHKSLVFASKVLAVSAIDLLTSPDLLKRAKEELRERLGDRVYKTPLPVDAKPPLDQWTE